MSEIKKQKFSSGELRGKNNKNIENIENIISNENADGPSISNDGQPEEIVNKSKRDFMILSTASFTAVGAALCGVPFITSMNPSADVLATATKEVNISNIMAGQSSKVIWQGKPVYIRNRTANEIEEAMKTPLSSLRDPQTDLERTKTGKQNWLIMLAICTHLGCVPISNSNGTWFCPCHGSYYDTSGRILKGPAPKNLFIPEYYFINDHSILIGAKA